MATGYQPFYTWKDVRHFGRQLAGNEANEALQLQQGKLNIWDLPRYQPIVQGLRNQSDRNYESLYDALSRSRTEGPAAALALERANESGNNAVLNFTNQLNAGVNSQVNDSINRAMKDRQQMIQYKLARDQMEAKENNGLGGLAGGLGSLLGKALPMLPSFFGAGAVPGMNPFDANNPAMAGFLEQIGKTTSPSLLW